MNILIAGSNKYLDEKLAIIEELKAKNHQVFHTCDIYEGSGQGSAGEIAVLKCLRQSDILYVVTDEDGYTGIATTARIVAAFFLSLLLTSIEIKVYSNHKLSDKDFEFWMDGVKSPEEL